MSRENKTAKELKELKISIRNIINKGSMLA